MPPLFHQTLAIRCRQIQTIRLTNTYTLTPLVGALGAAFAVISVRKLSQTETTATLRVYQAVFVGALAGIPLVWLWVTPDLSGFLVLLSIGPLATIGQWVGVKALRKRMNKTDGC